MKIKHIIAGTVIVVVLLAALFALIVVDTRPVARQRIKLTRASVATVREAIEKCKKDKGKYPTEQEGFGILVTNTFGYTGNPMDAWGTPISYRVVDDKPVVTSAGPDCQFGTADDIE